MDIELPVDRLTGDLDLVLRIDVGFVDPTSAFRASVRQVCFMNLIDFFGRGRGAMSLAAVVGAGFPSGLLRLGGGRAFGERSGLALAGPLLLLEQTGQPLHLRFQFGHAPLQGAAARARTFVHSGIIRKLGEDSRACENLQADGVASPANELRSR
jgi:hypothetical protein